MPCNFNKSYFLGRDSGYLGGYAKASKLINRNLKKVLQYVRGGKLLDVGCAYGFFLQEAQRYFDVFGLDISNFAIKEAKKRTKAKLTCCSADATWPYVNNFFDIITCFDCIEHIKKLEKLLAEATRTIKTNGIFYVTTPNKFIRNLIGDKDKTHINKHNILFWLKLFASFNFTPLEMWTEFPNFIGNNKEWLNQFIKKYNLPFGTNISFILLKSSNPNQT